VNALLVMLLGATFGAGLVLSGMTDPAYIRGFLDVTGDWRPELAFVMAGALALSLPFFQLIQPKMAKPMFSEQFSMPLTTQIDARLLVGAVIFGVGWTVSGYCPGPGVASFAYLEPKAFGFVAAMLVGFKIADWFAPAK
jgi:uncharacterized membrane protein YedE/YeeE